MAKIAGVVLIIGLLASLMGISPTADAHHGYTPNYDPDKVIRIDGTVKQFKFVNPPAGTRRRQEA